jgi:hypothetical protein
MLYYPGLFFKKMCISVADRHFYLIISSFMTENCFTFFVWRRSKVDVSQSNLKIRSVSINLIDNFVGKR